MTLEQPKYISANDVKQILNWPLVNGAVEEALKALGNSEIDPDNQQQSYAVQTARSITPSGDRSKLLLCMPGFVGNYKLQNATTHKNTLACKLVTSFASNQTMKPPLPNILANILLFNNQTGQLKCIMDGTQITAWRTAAASIIATKYLYFKQFPEGVAKPIRVAIIGCGVQGQSHALGMCKTFDVIDIYLWNRTTRKAEQLAVKLKSEFPNTVNVHVSETPKQAVLNADVVCVGTYSPNALIDYAMLKGDKVHVNTVGAGQIHFGEVAQDIYDHAVVYVDSSLSAKVELKDLKAQIIGEVGEVIRNGRRTENKRITIYQSMGVAAEDATVGQAVYDIFINDKM